MKEKEQSTSLNSESRKSETEFYFTSTDGPFEYTSALHCPGQTTPSKSESENLILTYLKVIASRQDTMWGVLRRRFREIKSCVQEFLEKFRTIAHNCLPEKAYNFLFANLGTGERAEEPCEEFPPLPPLPMAPFPEELLFFDDAVKSTYLSLKEVFCSTIDERVFIDIVRHLTVCKYESTVCYCIVYYLHVYPRLCELDSWEDVKFLEQLCELLKEKKETFNYKNLQRRVLRNRRP